MSQSISEISVHNIILNVRNNFVKTYHGEICSDSSVVFTTDNNGFKQCLSIKSMFLRHGRRVDSTLILAGEQSCVEYIRHNTIYHNDK